MGCDIHAHLDFVEVDACGAPRASYFCGFEIPRDYVLFTVLAGVRAKNGDPAPVANPKGFPTDIGSPVSVFCAYEINDELAAAEIDGFCSQEDAEEWVEEGVSRYLDSGKSRVSDPDAHSHSWLTADDVENANHLYCNATGKYNPYLAAVAGAMRAFDADERKARLVFWFKG